ncbi:hypothetical protein CEXT_628551, partial [Caerostris extrusa]
GNTKIQQVFHNPIVLEWFKDVGNRSRHHTGPARLASQITVIFNHKQQKKSKKHVMELNTSSSKRMFFYKNCCTKHEKKNVPLNLSELSLKTAHQPIMKPGHHLCDSKQQLEMDGMEMLGWKLQMLRVFQDLSQKCA